MFMPTDFPVSFFHESTTLLASPQFRSPVSFNLSQLGLIGAPAILIASPTE